MDAESWIYAAGAWAMLCLGGWIFWTWWTDRREDAERMRREDEEQAAAAAVAEQAARLARTKWALRQASMRPAPRPSLVQRASEVNRTSTAVITPTPTYDNSSDMMTSMLATQMLASAPEPTPFCSGGGGDFGGGGASSSWEAPSPSPSYHSSSSSSDSYSSSDSGSSSTSD